MKLTVLPISVALLCASLSHSFQLRSSNNGAAHLSRAQPLKTAGARDSIFNGAIPRLEPGLRIFRKRQFGEELQYSPFEIAPFSLDRLKEFESIPEHLRVFGRFRGAVPLGRLFANALQRLQTIASNFSATMKRIMTATLLLASSLGSSLIPAFAAAGSTVQESVSAIYRTVSSNTAPAAAVKRAGISAAAIATAMTSGPVVAHAGALKKYSKLSPTQKLATTPLYYVSDARGNSYLQPDTQSGDSDQRVVVYFMSSEDANQYLEEMAQTNAFSANNFRITTVSMEKIVNQIQSKKQSRKLGRYPVSMVYRIQPSSRQYANAERAVGERGLRKLQDRVSIPMFSAKGLAMKRPNGEVVTPYYFAMEDLMDDWEQMVGDSSSVATSNSAAVKSSPPLLPRVSVHDFTEVMCLAKGITADSVQQYADTNDRLTALKSLPQIGSINKQTDETSSSSSSDVKIPGIVPPRREIDMIRRYYRNQGMIRNEYNKSKYLGPKN